MRGKEGYQKEEEEKLNYTNKNIPRAKIALPDQNMSCKRSLLLEIARGNVPAFYIIQLYQDYILKTQDDLWLQSFGFWWVLSFFFFPLHSAARYLKLVAKS